MNFEKPEKSGFLKNEKKLLEISSLNTCIPKTHIIWGTVPQVGNETKKSCHFWSFLCLLPPAPPPSPPKQARKPKFKNHEKNIWRCHYFYTCATKIMMKWCMLTQIWSTTDIIFCHFRPFLPSFPSVGILVFRETTKFLFTLQARQIAYILLQKVK